MTKTESSTMGDKIYRWINERLDEGCTVYATTYLRSIKIQAKHRHMVRVRGEHCEVQQGRRWDSINGCKITATN